jgi:hypothetical protein
MTEASEATTETTESTREQASSQPETTRESTTQQSDVQVPKYRFDEVSKRAKDAEKRLQQLEQQNQQREEEAATKQGEWQTVAEKRLTKLDQANARIKELENQIVRDKRFRAWTQGASGIIRSDALGDAFEYVTEDEWSTVNEEDVNSVQMLAQGLAERKSFFAGGPVGAGSGGSSRPVLGLSSNKNVDDKRTTQLSSGRQTFAGFKNKRKHW